ncbi:UvrD-helicase domain-containing protein [Rhizobium beringeri]
MPRKRQDADDCREARQGGGGGPGTPFAVACITYTNAAVNEIDARVAAHLMPDDQTNYVVSTIHSFCLHHILRPFARSGRRFFRHDEGANLGEGGVRRNRRSRRGNGRAI